MPSATASRLDHRYWMHTVARALPWLAAVVIGAGVAQPHYLRVALLVPLVLIALALAQRAPGAVIVGAFLVLPMLGLIRRVVNGASGSVSKDPLLLILPAVVGVLLLVASRHHPLSHPTQMTRAVLVLCALSVAAAFNPLQGGILVGLSGLLFLLVPVLWFWIGRTLVTDKLLKRLFCVVAGLGVPVAIYGLAQTLIGLPSFDKAYVAGAISQYHALDVGGTVRAFGPLTSAFEYAAYLGCALLIWFVLAIHSRWRLVALPVIALLGYALVLASSRAIVVLTVVGLALVIAARRRARLSLAILAGLGLITVLSLGLSQVSKATHSGSSTGALVQHQVAGLANPFNPKYSTLGTHLGEIVNGLRLTALNPIGRGPGAVNLGAVKYGGAVAATESDPSNAGVALGVPGLVCYLIIAVVGVRSAYRRARSRRDLCSLATLGLLTVLALQWLNGGQYAVAPIPWLVLGWLDAPTSHGDGTSLARLPTSSTTQSNSTSRRHTDRGCIDPSEVAPSRLLEVLGRRRWFVAAVAILTAGFALGVSLSQTPVYTATAQILLAPTESQTVVAAGLRRTIAPPDVSNQVPVVQSSPVQDEVRKRLGSVPPVLVSEVGSSQVIKVQAAGSTPAAAASIANAYANAYVLYNQMATSNHRTAIADKVSRQVSVVQHRIVDLTAQLSDAAFVASPAAGAARAEQGNLIGQQLVLQQSLASLQLDQVLSRGSASVSAPATANPRAVSPDPASSAIVGLGVGLLLGGGLALLLGNLNRSVSLPDDVSRGRQGISTLAAIPRFALQEAEMGLFVHREMASGPTVRRAFQGLWESLQVIGMDRPLGVISITSSLVNEGKTTTVAQLAAVLAETGRRVAVIDCDLRRPRLHQRLGLANTVGLTSVLVGDVSLSAAIQQVPGQANLTLLASGPVPPNPAELLAGQRMSEVLIAMQRRVDVVLIDTPPVLSATDAALVSSQVDGTVLVVAAGRTTQPELSRSIELLAQVSAPLLGVVLNGLAPRPLSRIAGFLARSVPRHPDLPRYRRRVRRPWLVSSRQ